MFPFKPSRKELESLAHINAMSIEELQERLHALTVYLGIEYQDGEYVKAKKTRAKTTKKTTTKKAAVKKS